MIWIDPDIYAFFDTTKRPSQAFAHRIIWIRPEAGFADAIISNTLARFS
jgi:hypothetical protein